MLFDVLQRAGVRDTPMPQVHAAEPWGYRNRARMRVESGSIGYSRRASNDFLPIQECPIVSPLVWRAAQTLQSTTAENKVPWPVGTRSFELFANDDESGLQLSLHLDATVATVDRDAPRDLRLLCDALKQQIPNLAGAGLLVGAIPDPKQPRRVQESGRVEIARWGETSLLYNVDGTAYRVTRNAFFQVNRFLTATMRQLVTAGRTGSLAYDLFAGAGLFSVALAGQFAKVVAIEIGEPAATDLATHLRACGEQHRAIRSTVLDFLQRSTGNERPDLIVLDPPRAGLGPQTTRALARLNPREIVYVSCDAGTFAADCRTLVDYGYKLETLHLLDLFPQTFHTETIAVLRR
ncbi:MAG: class I SAM-dependent RNA methyltransferase [Janthinobacterium lividum]